MCARRLSVEGLRASRFELSTEPIKDQIDSHIACGIAATIESQSLPNVRHRGHRNPDRNQNRSQNRCPKCATVAVRTQIETSIDRAIVLEIYPKLLPNVRHRGHRLPNRNQNRQEYHLQNPSQIAYRCAPPPPSIISSKPGSIGKSHANSNRKSTPQSIPNRCKIDPRRSK